MLKEIGHFIRVGREAARVQKQHPQAEFVDIMATTADEQGYAEVRRELVGDLTGRVLEVGCGTGTMFQYYGPDVQVEAVEPELNFLALAATKAARFPGKIRAAAGDGMRLEFPDGTFDAVVLGLVLCSVPSTERVLAECFRVLRDGGRLRALDHVRSEAVVPGLLMDLVNPLWLRLNKMGCNLNRNPLRDIEAAGFRIDDVLSFKRFDTVLPAFPMRRVQAQK